MEIYSFENVSLLWNGRPVTGFAEGSTLAIEDNEDAILPKTGIDGSIAYAANANRSGKVTFTLSQTSASLPLLSADARDRKLGSLAVRDATADSGFILQCDNCAIIKAPKVERGKEISGGEISIYVPRVDMR